MKKGFVYLAGAGPGDPELITVKAARVLSEADCIIYDYLANNALLALYDCEKIYVGKQGNDHTLPQDNINELIIEKASQGKVVVRLKGGDPFIFGRGGEEAEELLSAGIPFAIIPGISSFYSAPAYAGIPVTHRDFSNAIEVITGHRRAEASDDEDINFPEYNSEKTFVFLMGMANISHIASSLINEKNFPAETPVGIISWGTRPEQKTLTGTLENIAELVKTHGMKPPAIIVVGRVVSLRDKLRWFDSQPLFGKTIVVTRSRTQASRMSAKLSTLGAKVIEFPTIEITPLEANIGDLEQYKWVIFTSQNAVQIFFDKLFSSKRDVRSLANAKIAAIGSATSDELVKYGIRCDLVPEKFVAESLLESILPQIQAGDNILIPCSEDARPVLSEGLTKGGAIVDRVHIYKSTLPKPTDEQTLDAVKNADCITFASSSTAKNFFSLVPHVNGLCASIGPITTKTLIDLKHKPAIEAETFTIDSLIEKIVDYYDKEKKS